MKNETEIVKKWMYKACLVLSLCRSFL